MASRDDLFSEIRELPVIDVYSRVRPDSPRGDLREIALSDEIQAELASANAPAEFFDIGSAKKMVQESAQYLPRIANTSAYWALTRILTDLMGGSGPLHEANVDDLWAKCESAGDADAVLEKGKIEKVLYTCDWHHKPPRASGKFAPVLDIGSLINEAHTSRTLDRLGEVTGQKVYEVADLKKAIIQLFRQAKEAGVLAASVRLEPMTDFEAGDRDAADRILSLVLLGQKVNWEDRKALRSYVMDLVLENCREHRMPVQFLLGKRYLRPSERRIAAYEQGMAAMYCDVFVRHSGVKFDLVLASDLMAHEFAVISRQFRNVFLDGFDAFLAIPSRLREILRDRIEMLPMTKCCALASGAACAEWVYGTNMLLRRELAFALSKLIEEGYLSLGTARDVARHYLIENPKRIYRIE